MNQNKIFLETEGDNWFIRNKQAISDTPHARKKDWVSVMLDKYKIKPRRILEIGCSNGWRLEALRKKYKAECVGIEPSLKAINDGKKRYPALKLQRGLASKLPITEVFDLVIVSFVFHWVGREELLQSVAEVDRVVEDNGLIIISDFAPNAPIRVPYHHLPNKDVYTYKMDYAKIFTSTALYSLIARFTFNHSCDKLTAVVDASHRSDCVLLRKSLTGFIYE